MTGDFPYQTAYIDLGPTVFTQWRAEQGVGILQPSDIGKTVTFSAI